MRLAQAPQPGNKAGKIGHSVTRDIKYWRWLALRNNPQYLEVTNQIINGDSVGINQKIWTALFGWFGRPRSNKSILLPNLGAGHLNPSLLSTDKEWNLQISSFNLIIFYNNAIIKDEHYYSFSQNNYFQIIKLFFF